MDLGANCAVDKLASLVELVPTLPKSLRRSVLRAGGREALEFRESLERMCEEDESSPIPEDMDIYRTVRRDRRRRAFATPQSSCPLLDL